MVSTIGTTLKKAREAKGLSLEDVSLNLKIQPKFLQALEEQKFNLFASSVHATGFLKNYCEYLGLPTRQILAFYRRDFGETKPSLETVKPVGVKLPLLTPDKLAGFLIIIIFLAFFSYLFYQYSVFVRPPDLTVLSPAGDVKVNSLQIEVFGKTAPGSQLRVNGQEVGVASDGTFSESVALKGGANTLTFSVTNKAGRQTQVVRSVVAEP